MCFFNKPFDRLFPVIKTGKTQGKCTCGCNSAGSCSKGGCSCGSKNKKTSAKNTDTAKNNNAESNTQKQAKDCVKHIFNKFDTQVETVSQLIPQLLVVPTFFDYNPLRLIDLSIDDSMSFEMYYNKGPIPPLLSRFILNLYCTLLI